MVHQFSFKHLICKLIFLNIFLLVFTSCTSPVDDSDNRPRQVRIVDLDGNPKPTKSYVPEMNAKILAAQGMKINEKTKELTPITNNSTREKAVVLNNTSNSPIITNDLASAPNQFQASAARSIPLPVVKKENNQEESVEYDLSSEAKSSPHINKNADQIKKFKIINKEETAQNPKILKPISYSKGIFVQVGSYDSLEVANKILAKNQRISSGKIEEVNVKGKKFYRVMLGPASYKQNADYLLQKLIKAGYKDAFIVKNK